ncbi:hypothetical protein CDAR_51361 [Caerostris darwini]|uniref:Uncharacterized protein n=1 Tax=Caerostris darwini TaxID=1538125 RepID=A0AAV4U6F8_9ARAC|nr:hypothetical protein CDAR_51361 [Caerostris darwini]
MKFKFPFSLAPIHNSSYKIFSKRRTCRNGSCSHHKRVSSILGRTKCFRSQKARVHFCSSPQSAFGNLSREYNQNHLSFKNRSIAFGKENRFCFHEGKVISSPGTLARGAHHLSPITFLTRAPVIWGKSFLAKSSENSNLPSRSTRCESSPGIFPAAERFALTLQEERGSYTN